MTRPRLLDLYAGAGGCSSGYNQAGFTIVGIDLHPQPNFPFEFYQADALETLERLVSGDSIGGTEALYRLSDFDAISASPPCQAHSTQTADRSRHADLIPETRRLLEATGLPYVIENVVGSPLINPVRLCGSSFGLDVRRHRLFETNWQLEGVPCDHSWQTPRFQSLDHSMVKAGRLASVVGVHGHLNYPGEREIRERAMQIDWMTPAELTQAIPPAYTELVGSALLDHLAALGVVAPPPEHP